MRDIEMDWDKPPSLNSSSIFESTAWPLTLTCATTEFKRRIEVAWPYGLTRYQPNMTVYYKSFEERSVANTGDDDMEMTSEHSTTSIDSTTGGWQVGAQLAGGSEGVSIGISAAYSRSWTTGTYKTDAVTIRTSCKSGYECRIETWTFHLSVVGNCRVKPLIVCGGSELNVCRIDLSRFPKQYSDYQARSCPLGSRGLRPYRHEACKVKMPILDQVGKPVTRMVRISEKFIPDDDEGEGSDKSGGGGGKTLKAVLKEDGWYRLDNGEWYDPGDGLYYGANGDSWYAKPGPQPDLSMFDVAMPRPRRSVERERKLVEIVFLDKPTF
ncbi:hypothetical protein HRG_000339 [Hirsutella rhossiliensis]|uniref:Uncharacterized protein n=1 Tax=Hirsutella rhossiliensis TaxID=111463 RepID=A0A9P8N664_9HYPO|nr:uncharacterized protein HRG_00339 [Hirsutella rhossiliensis]KAH0967697.1 hypothetical protein HRG_00339 [Hirsutella rhossiliensis]